MALSNRRSALAALVITGVAATALVGIAVDADGRLFGRGTPAVTAAAASDDELDDPAADTRDVAAATPADGAPQGKVFEFSAPLGGVTAVRDDTTVTLMRDGGEAFAVNLNREQTYVVSGAGRWFVGSDKPVAVFTGRDRRVQPIR